MEGSFLSRKTQKAVCGISLSVSSALLDMSCSSTAQEAGFRFYADGALQKRKTCSDRNEGGTAIIRPSCTFVHGGLFSLVGKNWRKKHEQRIIKDVRSEGH
jgi:hypothetical protein